MAVSILQLLAKKEEQQVQLEKQQKKAAAQTQKSKPVAQTQKAEHAEKNTFWSNRDGSIKVKIKKDHKFRLVYIAEKVAGSTRKQICQSFGVELYKDEDDARRIMTDIAKAYDENRCNKDDLYKKRDELSADLLRDPPKRVVADDGQVLKRPAAAAPRTPPPADAGDDADEARTPPPPAHRKARTVAPLDFSFGPEAILGMDDFA